MGKARIYISLAAGLTLAACTVDGLPNVVVRFGAGDSGPAPARPALVAADESQAALVGARILETGGAAADAAVAVAFTLAVTLPSSAGLDARGICLVHDGATGATLALDFMRNDDPLDMTAFVRAMGALHGRFGALPWGTVVAPAANLARFGATVSQILADRLRDGASLLNDRAALGLFTTERRQLLTAGDQLLQPALADALDRARERNRVSMNSAAAWQPAQTRLVDGLHVTTQRADDSHGSAPGASTGFVTADGKGGAVACTLTMGRAFGRGVMGAGYLLAADEPAELASAIVTDARNQVVTTLAASGPNAHAALARALNKTSLMADGSMDKETDDDTFVNVAACRGDGGRWRCEAHADPRGLGYAVVGEPGVQ